MHCLDKEEHIILKTQQQYYHNLCLNLRMSWRHDMAVWIKWRQCWSRVVHSISLIFIPSTGKTKLSNVTQGSVTSTFLHTETATWDVPSCFLCLIESGCWTKEFICNASVQYALQRKCFKKVQVSVSLSPTAICTTVVNLLMTYSTLNNKNTDMLRLTKEKLDSSDTLTVT